MRAWEIISEIARTILIMSATGGIIALLLLAIKPLIKNRIPKSVQYYLWGLVLIAMLVPFSTFLSLTVSTPMTPVQEIIISNVKSVAEQQEELAQERYNMPYDELEAPEQIEISFNEIGLMKGKFINYLLFALISMGGVVFLIEIVRYFIFVFKLRRRRLPCPKNEISLLNQLYNGRRAPQIYRNPLAPTPMLIGMFRPTIYLPDTEYTELQLRNVLLHELTHLRRHDVIVKWITALAVHVHWFNPLSYLVRREIDRACELSCDEAVIKELDNNGRQGYGDTLIAVAADTKTPKTIVSTTMCEEKKALKERLSAIMKHKGFPIRAIAFSWVLVSAVLCGIVVLGTETVDKVTVPVVSIYDGDGSVPLTADVNTGIVWLPTSVEVQAAYRDNTGESSIRIYCAPLDSDAEPLLLGGASRDVSNADHIKNTAVWNVAEEYPDGFDGSVWAVVPKRRNPVPYLTRFLLFKSDIFLTPTLHYMCLPQDM